MALLRCDATVMKSDLDKIHAVREFVALYAHLGISIEQCSVQFQLAAQNKLLTDRMPKTLKSARLCSLNTSLPNTDVYTHLAKLLKVAVTVPVTSASAERVHSKLKL